MSKITKFADIPQFTHEGSHECNYSLVSLVNYIEEEENADEKHERNRNPLMFLLIHKIFFFI